MATQLSTEEMDAVKHYLNNEQKASVLNITQVLADCAWAKDAAVTAVDNTGMDLEARAGDRTEIRRIDFPEPVEDAMGLRMAIMSLSMEADIPDGIKRVATAQVETDRAGRYLKALCSHFKKHATVTQDLDEHNIGQGSVSFEFGDCFMEAQENALKLQVEAVSDLRFNRIKHVVKDHLFRFSHKEQLQADWLDED